MNTSSGYLRFFLKFNFYRKNKKQKNKKQKKRKKNAKGSILWTSKILTRFKPNTIDKVLDRLERISSNFDEEISLMKEKFLSIRL